LRVRYRIDGMLCDRQRIECSLASSVILRFKVLSNIDITEKRIPQDGQFKFMHEKRHIDIRIATFPALHGEKMVVRILDRSHIALRLQQLGMPQQLVEQVQSLIHRNQGFFLVTGPTGSGKTTTLYAALQDLNVPERNIITLEDPVEYDLDGITQGRINPGIGFTFARGIRALLRQDPDVVMIGEIRDQETAQTAIEAALTGHMVLSTIHTHDAPSVIARLLDMEVDPFLVGAALTGVLAQRLARMICTACRIAYEPTAHERAQCHMLGLGDVEMLHKGQGCQACNGSGYKGRIGIFELMIMNDILRESIITRASLDALHGVAVHNGMVPLMASGYSHVARYCVNFLKKEGVLWHANVV
jgi:type IV pilus assembly protein PilB